jgi:hypothetical protein
MAMNSILQLDFADAWDCGIALLAAGERDDDPVLVVEGEYVLGVTAFWQGRFDESRRHLQAAIDAYAPAQRETHLTVYSQDPKVVCLSRLAWTLWFLGCPEQAAETRDAAVALADELNHPFSRCYASIYGAIVSEELHDEPERARLLEAAQTLAVATDRRFELLGRWAAALRLASRARRGDPHALTALSTAIGSETSRLAMLHGYFVALLARACLMVGEPRRGLGAVSTALADIQRTGARYMESELQCLHGELLVASRATREPGGRRPGA